MTPILEHPQDFEEQADPFRSGNFPLDVKGTPIVAKSPILRRDFLAAVVVVGTAVFLAGGKSIAAEPEAGKPVSPGKSLPFLMADDFEDLDFIAWRVEPGQPDPHNPLLEPEMPWDSGGVMGHGTVLRDPIDGLWKAWQVSFPAPPKTEKFDSIWFQSMITYLESTDGVRWRRPKMKFHKWPGHDETNIILDVWSSYASVIIEPGRTEWPYEMFVFRNPNYLDGSGRIEGLPLPVGADRHSYGFYRYRSKDGKDWRPVDGPLQLETSDSCYIYRFGGDGYVCYHKTELPAFPGGLTLFDVADGGVRLIGRRTSSDGKEWSDPTQIVMSPDWRDPGDTQFMELCPIQVPGGYIAVVSVYHNMTQTIDLQWAASRDGIHWWRPERRPTLANAPLGEFGGGMIWPMRRPVFDEDQLHVYYGGSEGLHGDLYNTRYSGPRALRSRGETLSRQSFTFGGDFSAFCRASWTADRLWALAPAHGGYTEGRATTRKSRLGGRQLVVNVTTRPGGRLRVELLDGAGRVLPGYSADDCEPVQGDHHALQVKWKGGAAAPANASQARLLLSRAFLYGMEWR